MSITTYIFGILAALLTLAVVIEMLRRGRMRERHAIWWIIAGTLALLIGIFPSVLNWLADLIGVGAPVNLVFFVSIAVLFLVCIQHSSELTTLESKSRTLGRTERTSGASHLPARTADRRTHPRKGLGQALRLRNSRRTVDKVVPTWSRPLSYRYAVPENLRRPGDDASRRTSVSAAEQAPPRVAPQLHVVDPLPRARRPLAAFFTAWVVLSILCALWAWATPPSASPDEPAHIVRAASVVRGELVGTPSPSGNVVSVPQYVADAHAVTCFAFNPAVPANCPLPAESHPDRAVNSVTSAGLYNPLYYALVGWPTLVFHDSSGIVAMRIVSGVLTSLFAALAFAIVMTFRNRRLPALAFAIAVTPMVLFLGGTVNPSAIEATSTLAVFCGMLAIITSPDPARLAGRAAVVAVSAVLAVSARGLSPLWVLFALGLPLLLTDRRTVGALLRTRAVIVTASVVGLGTLAALGWTLGTNSLANAIAHPGDALQFPGVGASPLIGFEKVLFGTVSYSQGLVGLFGWLDTPAPGIVLYGWGLAVGALAVSALLVLRGRKLLVASTLVGAFLLLPPLVQAIYIHGGGMIWQGRYNLPLFLCLVIGLATFLADTAFTEQRAWRRLRVLVVVGAAVGQLWAFEAALQRYAVGTGGSLRVFLLGSPPWAPAGGVVLVLVVAALVFAASAVLLLRASASEWDEGRLRPVEEDRAPRRAIRG